MQNKKCAKKCTKKHFLHIKKHFIFSVFKRVFFCENGASFLLFLVKKVQKSEKSVKQKMYKTKNVKIFEQKMEIKILTISLI